MEVTDYIITYLSSDSWKGGASEQPLTYQLDVEAIRRSPIVLSYTIQQDPYQATATLNVGIGKETIHIQKEIGEMNTSESVIYSNDIDITRYIKQPGRYELTFTLKTKKPIMENTWLLKEIKVVGVEGNLFSLPSRTQPQ